MERQEEKTIPKPEWLRIRLTTNGNFRDLRTLLKSSGLNTVCEEARCPNMHECWALHRTATFMILGEVCTRKCRFCAVSAGVPAPVDPDEPRRLARSVKEMGLRHVVITMVTRDDLPDGGAHALAETVLAVRRENPDCSIEVLASDFQGNRGGMKILADSSPDILSHNIETVRRLTPLIRSRSSYERSLEFLAMAGDLAEKSTIKSSIMLGLGEEREEVLATMDDLLRSGVEVLNIGQYLRPSRANIDVKKYWTPDEFEELREEALRKGFVSCDSGPLVRSSYHAGEQYLKSGFRKGLRRADAGSAATRAAEGSMEGQA